MRKILLALLIVTASCTNKKPAADTDIYYTCSMDPQVRSDRPGRCPICKMELTPVRKNTVTNTDNIVLSEEQQRLGNITTMVVSNGTMNPVTTLNGTLRIDESRVRDISAPVMGRIEKLYIKTPGDAVRKGAPVFELYSEELNNAKQEYLVLLQRKQLFAASGVADYAALLHAAKAKLKFWGVTGEQLHTLERTGIVPRTTTYFSPAGGFLTDVLVQEGSAVMEGMSVLRIADLSKLWVEAEVYTAQRSQLPRSGPVMVEIPGEGIRVSGTRILAAPELVPGAATGLLRIAIANPGNQWQPGMPALIHLEQAANRGIYLPSDAVIRERDGATVWLRNEDGSFRNVMVHTGREADERIEIVHGIQSGDEVVMSGAYLLNSEYIFKRGANPMAGHAH